VSEEKEHKLLNSLISLRWELVDWAFTLEKRGQRQAGEMAMLISARLEECYEGHLPEKLRSSLSSTSETG
jgi:hypothetical protein